MADNITFRTQLLGGVTEFCQNSGLPLFGRTINLVELIVLLARYHEEGVKLCPKVYLTNDMAKLNSMLPDSECLKIGSSTSDTAGLHSALKKCAPLATGGWLIYIESDQNEIEYGVFRGSGNPISVLVDDVVMTPNDDMIVVKAFQVADDCVEVRANNGNFHYIFLNHRKEDSPPPLQYLDKLIAALTEKVIDEDREPTASFLTRLFFESLRHSHGCIVAVTNMKKPPKYLSNDGIILDNPIDFAKLVGDLKASRIPQSLLDSKGYLLNGMLNSDGIILFDNNSRLLGYNCFVKVSKYKNIVGGARKRAFSGLSTKLGKGLCAVFIQSQDGWSDFKGN